MMKTELNFILQRLNKVRFWFDFDIITLVLLLCSADASSQSQISGLPFVRIFYPSEYKAGIQNWQIAQDKRGLLYIANNFGLLEFDGNHWEVHGLKNGTKVRSIAIDARGRIYAGGQGDFGYFFPDVHGRLTYISLADSLKEPYRNFDETWRVYIDNEKVYFCTLSRIYIYNGSNFTILDPTLPINLSFLVNRQLYVTEQSTGINIVEGSTMKPIKGGSFFSRNSVSSILSLNANNLLISTFQQGIFQLSNGQIQPWNEKLQQYFVDANVNCMVRLRNGNLAIGTQNSGLILLNDEGIILMQLTRGRGLENGTILSIYEDDLSNLWIGQNNGLAFIEIGSPFTFINEQSGLPGTGYSAYLNGAQLYLGTNTGLYVKDKNGLEHFTQIKKSNGQVYHIDRYADDLLMGHHNGASRIEGTKAFSISSEPGSWIFLALKDQPSKLIEGTYSGLQLYEKIDNHWKLKKKLKGFQESSRVMAQDSNGDLWVTHGYKGAFKLRLSNLMDSIINVSYYGTNKGLPSNRLINVFNIRSELLFTTERGVFKYDSITDTFKPQELISNLLGKAAQITYMEEDALGNIYFIGQDQIGVLKKNAIGDYKRDINTFTRIKRFLNDDLENITILNNNEVLFGAKEGFIHFDPNKSFDRKTTFKALIRKVSSTYENDSVLFYGNYTRNDSLIEEQMKEQQPNLSYKSNSINFTFSATSYEGKSDLLYQYDLDPYEKGWSEWIDHSQKEYTNLKEGHYTFSVRAKNVNGEISEEAHFEFTINPPWYRSILAYSFYTFFVLALLYTGFNILDKKYQRQQRIMSLRQKKELYQKENEFSKLTQESEEEITRLQNEKLESELQHKNNELATSTMHLLNKNEFIATIKTNLSQIMKSSHEEVRRELQQITKDIENNISADADWEQFEFHFDRVHGDFSNRFKITFTALSPQDLKLSAYLRMNLSTKEIAQLLNISVRGVEISRYRLRKKLNLDRNKNLQEFILNF